MHVITRKALVEAAKQHPDCATALDQWFRIMKKAEARDFSQLRGLFNSVDKVGQLYVFNVGGNKLRLIAAVHFNTQRVFIRDVLTHKAYDKGDWRA